MAVGNRPADGAGTTGLLPALTIRPAIFLADDGSFVDIADDGSFVDRYPTMESLCKDCFGRFTAICPCEDWHEENLDD